MGDRYPLLKFSIFTVVCLGFAAWLIAVIGNISPFADRTVYNARFEDVTGLLVNDAVKVSGVTVGKVTGITLEDGGVANVSFEVDSDVTVTDDSQLAVRWRDVFGLRFLYVQPGGGEVVAAEHTFPVAQTSSPADLGNLLQRLTPVISALDPDVQNELLAALQEALVGKEQTVRDLISRGASLTQAIASRDEEIGRLLQNSGTIFEAYANREAELRGLLTSFANVSETLASRNDTLDRAVTTIADGMAELGEFVDTNQNEVRRTLDELEALTDVLALHRDDLEDIVQTSGRGLITYHRVSRLGQWFNIRAVGMSSGYQDMGLSEHGAELPECREPCGSGSPADFFSAPAADGEGR